MLMPALSVTGVGLAIAIAGIILGKPAARSLLGALAGAWIGFLAGAVGGLMLDVLMNDGIYVVLIGHLGAAAGAVKAVAMNDAAELRGSPE